MRARRREINIFNMSLLDILCGALGAFCFMMLVALPYYKPPGSAPDLKKAQEETARMLHDLEQMKEQMRDPKSAEDMSALLERLKAHVQALQGQVNILTAEKEQLVQEKSQLAQENQGLRAQNKKVEAANGELQARLNAKRPFTVVVQTNDPSQGVDVVLFKPSVFANGPAPVFTQWLKGNFDHLHSVRDALLRGHGLGLFVFDDLTPDSQSKVFVRLTNPLESRRPTKVDGALVGDEGLQAAIRLPEVALDLEPAWIFLGTMSIDQNSQVSFQSATTAERVAAWQTLTGNTPAPTPAPRPTPTEEERTKQRERVARQRQLQGKFGSLMRLSPSEEANLPQILQLADELLREMPANDSRRKMVLSAREDAVERKSRRDQASPMTVPTP